MSRTEITSQLAQGVARDPPCVWRILAADPFGGAAAFRAGAAKASQAKAARTKRRFGIRSSV